MTDWTPEELDALVARAENHGAWDYSEAITALRARETMIEAAAIERAATSVTMGDTVTKIANSIRALAKPGARTLLDQRIAEAEQAGYERGLREAQAKKGDTK